MKDQCRDISRKLHRHGFLQYVHCNDLALSLLGVKSLSDAWHTLLDLAVKVVLVRQAAQQATANT